MIGVLTDDLVGGLLALWWLLARLSLGSPCITQSDWCLLEA